ncbi:hemerythrin family protein [Sulfurimonas sp. SWIR-19]|uniref:bacteriohemerythrin n=1 Tax=Sulfurimonas sp. SWIR-19 TaxID=2878390 RepID=UPI001CF35B3E|nr:hemerythrin family protein [Sulfurimonas sp. SWIR-19]UCN01351.1 hemerythrin family protein [Sulfurimonas sp. SWIR-19]
MALVYIEQVEDMDVEEMQKTHENEIKILNAIDNLAISYDRGEATLEELEAKIEEYVKHVHEHFANEERLMQEYDFPSYDMHKTAHDMFLEELNMALKNWKNYKKVSKITDFIRRAPEWIVLHVNTVDYPTANYLAKKMKGL